MRLYDFCSSNNSTAGTCYVVAPFFSAAKNTSSSSNFNTANFADTVFSVSFLLSVAILVLILLAVSIYVLITIGLIIGLITIITLRKAKQ